MIRRVGTSITKAHGRSFMTAQEWLVNKGYDSPVIRDVIRAFPNGGLSASDLDMMGEKGVKELIASVQRQQQKVPSEKLINVKIEVPHDRYSFTVKAPVGGNFYTLSKEDKQLGSYLECACSGITACSTCHVIVNEEDYLKLPPPEDNELDMLDLASSYTATSRLGCQITFTPAMDGLRVSIPKDFNNLFGSSAGNSS